MLHVITRFILGGAQENTLLSVLGLSRLGRWRVYLATGPAEGPEGSLLERARAEGIRPLLLRHMRREVHPVEDLAAYRELFRLILRLRPHVVHTHSSKAGVIGRLAAFHAGVPVVVHTVHGPSFHPYERPWRNRLFVFLERWAARRCRALVSVAEAMSRQYLDRGIGRPQQYLTIRSGVEVERFLRPPAPREELRRRWGLPAGRFVFAKVSRIAPLKGHEDVLRAAAELAPRAPGLHLVFAGDGVLGGRMREMAARLGLDGRVTFTGLVPPGRIPELLHACDALVHASYREGLPRAVVEAGLAGLPQVAYAACGAPEAIEDGVTGFLVEPGDVPALAERMLRLCRRPGEARRMGARARERLRREFDWRKMVRELDALYRRLLAGRPP